MIGLEEAKKIAFLFVKDTKFNKLEAIRESSVLFYFAFTDGIKAPGGGIVCEVNKETGKCTEFDFLNKLEDFYGAKSLLSSQSDNQSLINDGIIGNFEVINLEDL